MATYRSCISILFICSLSLAGINNATAIAPGQVAASARSSLLSSRSDLNLTSLSNATAIVQNLDFTANCTVAISWHYNLPTHGAGFGNDTINVAFLRMALPVQYQNESDDQIASFYDAMSFGNLSRAAWIGTAKNVIEIGCIAPRLERQISLTNLDAAQNCTATAIFLSRLGWLSGPQNYTVDGHNDNSWLEFLHAALPPAVQENITDLELFSYRNFFLASEAADDITSFLKWGYEACQRDICEVQGYTGNPDIGGIGVISSYTVEAALVTLYFAAINFQLYMKGIKRDDKIPEKFRLALQKASDGLLDGALFFSLSISSAGWVSFQYGQSYYEKLVFTSANVLALSALFAFLGIFTREGRKKRGDYILVAMLLGILTESAIQYIVYLREPNQRYNDYACLHTQFQYQGYHPEVFEALFFLLLGLSVIAGIVALIRMKYYKRGHSKVQAVSEADRKAAGKKRKRIDFWVTVTRIFIQTVAIVVMWVELVYLWKIRNIMAKIAGDTWLEDEWGFGQILTLFIWLPPIIDIVGWLVLKREWLGGEESDGFCKCKCSERGPSCQCLTMPSQHTEGDEKFGAQAITTPVVTTSIEKITDA